MSSFRSDLQPPHLLSNRPPRPPAAVDTVTERDQKKYGQPEFGQDHDIPRVFRPPIDPYPRGTVITCRDDAVCASHTRAVWSSLAVTMRRPSGENAAVNTEFTCPYKHGQFSACLRIPYPSGFVTTCRDDAPSIGGENGRVNTTAVPAQSMLDHPRLPVPIERGDATEKQYRKEKRQQRKARLRKAQRHEVVLRRWPDLCNSQHRGAIADSLRLHFWPQRGTKCTKRFWGGECLSCLYIVLRFNFVLFVLFCGHQIREIRMSELKRLIDDAH